MTAENVQETDLVDVESMEYSYDFDDDLQQEWTWTEKYVGTRVASAHFDESVERWLVTTEAGKRVGIVGTGSSGIQAMPGGFGSRQLRRMGNTLEATPEQIRAGDRHRLLGRPWGRATANTTISMY